MVRAKKKTDEERGAELKKKREDEWGLTQVELAELLGMHPISLSRFERGAETIPIMMELALCELERRLATKKAKKKKP